MIPQTTYLLDGPLMGLSDRRRALIGQMATDLLAQRAYGSYADAQDALRALGHDPLDVNLLAPEALELAREEISWRVHAEFDTLQEKVAREMRAP